MIDRMSLSLQALRAGRKVLHNTTQMSWRLSPEIVTSLLIVEGVYLWQVAKNGENICLQLCGYRGLKLNVLEIVLHRHNTAESKYMQTLI